MAAPVTPPPTALAPLSNKQIVNQATSTVTKSYRPAYTDLSQQTKRAQGISDKRTADNKYYQAWLDTQMQALRQHADSSNAALVGMQQQINTAQNAAFNAQPTDLVNAANARSGNVSNNAQSTDFGSRLAQNQATNRGLLLDTEQQATSNALGRGDQLNAVAANNFNVIQAEQQKQLNDLDTTLTKIGDARTKLNQAKTGDIAKEIARLQGVEIQKAQSNRDYTAAVAKLNLSKAQLASLNAYRASSLAIQQQNANTAAGQLSVAQQRAMTADANFQLSKQKYGDSVAKDLYLREHGLGVYKVPKGHVTPPLSQASQNAIYNQIGTIQGSFNSLMTNNGLSPQAAWHILHTGGYVQSPAGANGKPGRVYVKPVSDTGLLNAAYNTLNGSGSGLSPGDLHYLEKVLGLTNPAGRLRVNHQSGTNAGHGAVA